MKKVRGRKWKRGIIYFIAGMTLILLAAPPVLNKVIENNMKEKLKQLAPLAFVRFSSIRADLVASSISINNLSITFQPDTSDSRHYHSFNFSKADFTGINFIDVILNKKLLINKLKLNKGEIGLDQFLLDKKDSFQYDLLSRMPFKNVSVKHFETSEANVWAHLNQEKKLQIKHLSLTIAGLRKSFDSSLSYSSFNCSMSNIKYSIPHTYRTLQVSSLDADSKKGLLKIADAKITTQYSKIEYGKKLGRQADYLEATVPRIEISEIDFKQLPQKKLVADKIMISEGKFYFFRDRRLPRQLKKQPMPNDYLEEFPIEVRVNTFKLNNASAIYEEFPKVGNQQGYLAIGKMNISMSPMLNRPAKNDPGYSKTYIEGSIMNAGLIRATIRAPLRKNIYFIKGDIKNLDLPKLNPSAENLGRFHIKSGILNFLDFQFTATEEMAKGQIVGEYHDLLIDRLKIRKGEKKVAKVPSFFLKRIIIPKNKDKSLDVKKRTGKIEYVRDPTRLVTFYLLKSLLDGIRASFTLGFLLPK